MKRSLQPEIMDGPDLPVESMNRVFGELTLIHKALGNVRSIFLALSRHSGPLDRVLDLGCGRGELLYAIQTRFGVEAIGVDLHGWEPFTPGVPIIHANAVSDPLPPCDVAIAVCLIHHLTGDELVALIRNVGRSCRRFLILDLVRSPLPLVLFALFIAPFVHRITALDGLRSIRRSYTPRELNALVRRALEGSGGTYRHSVRLLYVSQIVDISYA